MCDLCLINIVYLAKFFCFIVCFYYCHVATVHSFISSKMELKKCRGVILAAGCNLENDVRSFCVQLKSSRKLNVAKISQYWGEEKGDISGVKKNVLAGVIRAKEKHEKLASYLKTCNKFRE